MLYKKEEDGALRPIMRLYPEDDGVYAALLMTELGENNWVVLATSDTIIGNPDEKKSALLDPTSYRPTQSNS